MTSISDKRTRLTFPFDWQTIPFHTENSEVGMAELEQVRRWKVTGGRMADGTRVALEAFVEARPLDRQEEQARIAADVVRALTPAKKASR